MKIVLLMAAGKILRDGVARGRPLRTYAPTTLLVLEALVPRALHAEVVLLDQGVEALPEDLDADLLAISAITSAAPEAYRVADRARQKGIPVVFGGHHASVCTEEALGHADAVVVGFAEQSWPRLLEDFARGRMRRLYEDDAPASVFDVPPLDRALVASKPYFTTDTTEATRGCPNRCGFCVVHRFGSGRPQTRPVRSVVGEIAALGRRMVFLDANLFAFRSYLRELLHEVAALGITWFGTATLRLAEDEELIALAAKSGCRGLLVGFESVVQESLDATGKTFNKAERYRTFVRTLHDHGISVLGSFAFGFDHDDGSVFDATVQFALESKMDLVKLGILTPLPGTDLHATLKQQGRIVTEDWELYDTQHCVFQPARMSKEELEEGFRRAHRQIYRYPSIAKRVVRRHAHYAYILPANLVMRRFR